MFDFQKEVIINSNKLEDGVTNRFTGIEGMLRVLRCADYKKEGLIDGIVYKTTPSVGEVTSVTFNVPTETGIYQVLVGFSLDERYLADYAYPWYKFGKPLIAEFELEDSDLSDNAKVKAADIMAAAIKMAMPNNYCFAKVEVKDNQVKISGVDSHQSIKLAELRKSVNLDCPDTCNEVTYEHVESPEIIQNKMEVGTGAWIQENLRFPSYPNLRYAALNEEEYPIKGALYYQYSFGYCMPRRGLHGQGTVGQALRSITTHTFYVLSSLKDEFEKAITDAFGKESIIDVNVPYKLEILNDYIVSIQDITNGEAVFKKTISGPDINGDVTSDYKWSVANEDNKFEIGETSGQLTVATGKTPEVGDKFVVTLTYKNVQVSQEFTVGV